jgi:hypothetical protein
LGGAAGLAEAVLLPLNTTGITREHATLLQGRTELGIHLDQGPSDSKAQRIALARGATTVKLGDNIVLPFYLNRS